eukprot:1036301_1
MSCWWVSSTACSSSPSRAFYWLHLSLSLLCSSPSLYPMMDPLNLLVFRSCLFLMMGCGNGHCHGSGFVVLLAECEYLMDGCTTVPLEWLRRLVLVLLQWI